MNGHFTTRACCPACGGTTARTLFSRPYDDPLLRSALERFYAAVGGLDYGALHGAEFVVQRCLDCTLVFQRDVPDDHLLGRLYEEWISPTLAHARFHAGPPLTRTLEIGREVFVSLSLARASAEPRTVLDYGCGWGEWGRMAQAFGAETWGTELSPTRRSACQRAGINVVADRELPDGKFDVINIDQVLEHLPAPAGTLRHLKSKLRPGGVVRIAVPNGWRIERSLRNFDGELRRPRLGGVNAIAPLEHLNGFTARSLVRMFAGCGLSRRRPPWHALGRALIWPPGVQPKLKQLALPFYLRSRWTTQMWFVSAPPVVT